MSQAQHDEKIYVLDQVKAKPGQAEAFLKAYMERYAPAAKARGLTHEFTWVTPTMWLKDQSNTLFIIWSVRGAPAWWAMEHSARRDPAVLDWWRDAESFIESRTRCFLSDVADLGSLTNV